MSEEVRQTAYYISPLAQGPTWTHKPTSDNNSMKPITSGSKRLAILVLGDPNVGRSSLISTYLNGTSAVTNATADNNSKEEEHPETHEINVYECLSPIANTSTNLQQVQSTTKLKSVKVTITNPSSSVSHEQLTRQHLSEAAKPNSVIVAYSTNSPESLVSILEDWADYLGFYCPEVPVLLVGLQDDEVMECKCKNKEKLANDNDQLKSMISRIEHGEDRKSLTGHDQHSRDIKNDDTAQQAETDAVTKIETTPHSELLKLGKEELSENTLINSKSIIAETKLTTPISSHHSTHKIDPRDAKSVAGMIGAVCHLSCSSLTGVNVDAVFDAAINAGMQGLQNRKKVSKMRVSSITNGSNASAEGHSKESSGCCCIV